jgi:hypothetical protein
VEDAQVAVSRLAARLTADQPNARIVDRRPDVQAAAARTVWLDGCPLDVEVFDEDGYIGVDSATGVAFDRVDAYLFDTTKGPGRYSVYLQIGSAGARTWTVRSCNINVAHHVEHLVGGSFIRMTGGAEGGR